MKLAVCFILCFLHALYVQLSLSAHNLPGYEISALHELYNATVGAEWAWRPVGSHWVFTPTANPCTGHWQGITCVLPSPGTTYYVSEISLSIFNLVGTIPESIGVFSHMNALNLMTNHLSGTIPASVGNLTQLSVLELQTNSLTGPIPNTICKLPAIQILTIGINRLSGPLPSCMGNLTTLTQLYVHYNKLNGTLPASLSQLPLLQFLNVDNNAFTGTIPSSYGQLSSLTSLSANNNLLSGTISAAMGLLSKLSSLYLTYNRLEGTIPVELTQLTLLKYLELNNNILTGTLPHALGNLVAVIYLTLSWNMLTGSIPDTLYTLTALQDLALEQNHLTGSIPASVGYMSQASSVLLYSNHLTGTIPDSIALLQRATQLQLHDNWLTGFLPAQIGNMTALTYLYANDNLLHGPLPDSLSQLSALQELQLYNNSLSGVLSRKFSTLSGLTYALLSDNRFTGSLNDSVNATQQTSLTTIEVNNNQLTGTLPSEIFELPALENFVAVSNCFHGTIPLAACNASVLGSLILDGLSSATSCRRSLPSGAYLLSRSVGGTLPICLFQLSSLNTLHLSGNKFTGSIPSTVALSDGLNDVSLSHNTLTGVIPEVIQQRRWYNLDLSYNRLSATLSGDFGCNRSAYAALLNLTEIRNSVSLENNRLSGRIPGYLQTLQNVSILGTNLFSCALDGSNLPSQDSDRDNYQCGSSAFDVPYYVWLILVGVACSALAWFARVPAGAGVLRSWYNNSQRVVDDRPVLASLMHAMDALCGASFYAGAFIVLVLVPCYAALSHYSGTLTHQYAWAVSAAFLSGPAPVAVELPLWLLLTVLVLVVLRRASLLAHYLTRGYRSWSHASAATQTALLPKSRRYFIYAVFLLIDTAVVVGANVAYVYIAIYQSSALLVLAQVLMSFFKLLWNNVCLEAILRALVGRFAPQLLVGQGYAKAYRVRLMSLQVFTSLLNSVVVPCLVVLAVSPNCFYHVFQPAPEVRSAFIYRKCLVLGDTGECLSYVHLPASTSYDAPFTFSYQCSSSLITYYAPAFVNLCIITVFVTPAAQLASLQLLQHLPSDLFYGYAQVLLRLIAPPILLIPASSGAADRDAAHAIAFVKASQVLASLSTSLGVLLTFGVVFPPLGFALTFTAAATVLLMKLTIGRFLCSADEQGQLSVYLGILEEQCEGAGAAGFLRSTAWMVVTLSCLFYTLFLFDTLGDSVGLRRAVWVLVVVPLLPVLMYLALAFAERKRSSPAADGEAMPKEAEDGGAAEGIELGTIATVSPVHLSAEKK